MSVGRYERAHDAVRIRDFSDRTILGIMHDLGGQGNVEVRALASRIFGVADTTANQEELHYLRKCVTARLTWMRRYGFVDKGEPGSWRISPVGLAMLTQRLSATQERIITQTEDIRLLEVTHVLGERMLRAGLPAWNAMRREFLFQNEARKRLAS